MKPSPSSALALTAGNPPGSLSSAVCSHRLPSSKRRPPQNRHNAAGSRSRNPRALLLLAGLQRPRVRLPQVRELGPEPPEPQSLIRPQQLGLGRLGEGQVVPGVPAADLRLLPALPQLSRANCLTGSSIL